LKTESAFSLTDWPRGIGKNKLKAEAWLKDVAPITELRKWFGHDPTKWSEFRSRYVSELKTNPNGWLPIDEAEKKGAVTLIYDAIDEKHNNAAALREFLQTRLTSAK
jgi:uncharacterized protein YeaO (DUF488 family)